MHICLIKKKKKKLFQSLDINVVCHEQCHEKSSKKNVVCTISSPQAIKLLFQTVSKHCKIQEDKDNCQSRSLNSYCFWLHNTHTHLHTQAHTHIICTHTCIHWHNACTDITLAHTHRTWAQVCIHVMYAHSTYIIHVYMHIHGCMFTHHTLPQHMHVLCMHMHAWKRAHTVHTHACTTCTQHMHGHTPPMQAHVIHIYAHIYHMHVCTHTPAYLHTSHMHKHTQQQNKYLNSN